MTASDRGAGLIGQEREIAVTETTCAVRGESWPHCATEGCAWPNGQCCDPDEETVSKAFEDHRV